jgi:hypothetical protein
MLIHAYGYPQPDGVKPDLNPVWLCWQARLSRPCSRFQLAGRCSATFLQSPSVLPVQHVLFCLMHCSVLTWYGVASSSRHPAQQGLKYTCSCPYNNCQPMLHKGLQGVSNHGANAAWPVLLLALQLTDCKQVLFKRKGCAGTCCMQLFFFHSGCRCPCCVATQPGQSHLVALPGC